MTPTLNTACVAETAPVAAAVELAAAEQVLRDIAYVLKLTRRVKDELMADRRAESKPAAGRKAEGALVA
jgi:hypothetical protein